MARILRAKHVDYTLEGIPRLAELPAGSCVETFPEFIEGRFVDYALSAGAVNVAAHSWQCCDDLKDLGTGTGEFVEPFCWPVGDGPGIRRIVFLYATEVTNCLTARNQRAILTYSGGKWYGDLSFRGGSLDFVFECQSGLPTDPAKFKLSWTGCDTGFLEAGVGCVDPIAINFGQATLPTCCDCSITGPPSSTDEAPEVNFYLVANCKRVIRGQHIDYIAGSPLTPVLAKTKPCETDQIEQCGCNMTCPIVASLDCGCMSGTYDLNYVSGAWQYIGGFPDCPSAAIGVSGQIEVSCLLLAPSHLGTGTGTRTDYQIRLTASVVCGVDTVGGGSVIVPECDLENLFVEIPITLTSVTSESGTGGGGGGLCTFIWNEMAATWTLLSSTCTEDCDTCPEGPDDTSPGGFDGDTRSQACTGCGVSLECCVGAATLVLMR